MRKRASKRDNRLKSEVSTLSDLQLARFLAHLADLYTSPAYGNPLLASSLRQLSAELRERGSLKSESKNAGRETNRELPFSEGENLRDLKAKAVDAFLRDQSKSKVDLLRLASQRFSMPISQLKRMNIEQVRQAVNSALLHESSIEILSQEAGREGRKRQS